MESEIIKLNDIQLDIDKSDFTKSAVEDINKKKPLPEVSVVHIKKPNNILIGSDIEQNVNLLGTIIINEPKQTDYNHINIILKENNNIDNVNNLNSNECETDLKIFDYKNFGLFLLIMVVTFIIMSTVILSLYFIFIKNDIESQMYVYNNKGSKLEKSGNNQISLKIRKKWYKNVANFSCDQGKLINNYESININKIKLIVTQELMFECQFKINQTEKDDCLLTLRKHNVIGKIIGYKRINYHFVIHMNGVIYEGRSLLCHDDEEFLKDNGYSTLIIGISLCHSANPFSYKKTINETNTIRNLITYLKDIKVLSSNYTFQLWDYCENGLLHHKLKEISNHRVSLYDLKTAPHYKRLISRYKYVNVTDKILDDENMCSISTNRLKNEIFPYINTRFLMGALGEVYTTLGMKLNSNYEYFHYVKDRLKIVTSSIKYCNLHKLYDSIVLTTLCGNNKLNNCHYESTDESVFQYRWFKGANYSKFPANKYIVIKYVSATS